MSSRGLGLASHRLSDRGHKSTVNVESTSSNLRVTSFVGQASSLDEQCRRELLHRPRTTKCYLVPLFRAKSTTEIGADNCSSQPFVISFLLALYRARLRRSRRLHWPERATYYGPARQSFVELDVVGWEQALSSSILARPPIFIREFL